MQISFNANNSVQFNKINPKVSKNTKVFATNASPTFTGINAQYLVRTGKHIQRTPLFTRIKMALIRLLKKLPFIAKNTADDVARTGTFKRAARAIIKPLRRIVAYCAAGIAAAVLFVKNIGDDIKVRMRTKVKPVSLMKDIYAKGKTRIALMNSANYAAAQRAGGPGVGDIVGKFEDGASRAIGVNIEGSAKKMIWSKVQSLFTSG